MASMVAGRKRCTAASSCMLTSSPEASLQTCIPHYHPSSQAPAKHCATLACPCPETLHLRWDQHRHCLCCSTASLLSCPFQPTPQFQSPVPMFSASEHKPNYHHRHKQAQFPPGTFRRFFFPNPAPKSPPLPPILNLVPRASSIVSDSTHINHSCTPALPAGQKYLLHLE